MSASAPAAARYYSWPARPDGAQKPGGRGVLSEVAAVGGRDLVEIKTIDCAVALLDQWAECARERLRALWKLEDNLFWMRHARDVQYFRAELYRAQLKAAGVVPADEAEASTSTQQPS